MVGSGVILMRQAGAILGTFLTMLVASGVAGGSATAAGTACVHARIHGRLDCLVVGRGCHPKYESEYQRSGFHCGFGAGRYTLRYKLHITTPKV